MNKHTPATEISRRNLIKLMAAGAGTLCLASLPRTAVAAEGGEIFHPNVYLEISLADGVVLWTKKAEMGQHVHTAIAMMVADELGADLDRLVLRQADTHPRFGFVGTGGSSAIPGHWRVLRPLIAAAREMLIEAAAQYWRVSASALMAAGGFIRHEASGREGRLEMFAARAADLPVPANPRLKRPSEFRYIGQEQGRRDTADILSGKAVYGIDVRLEGMRFAVMARPTTRDASLVSFDRVAAMQVKGVEAVYRIGDKLAVVGRTSWAAMQGRAVLDARWQEGAFREVNSASIQAEMMAALSKPGMMVREEGMVPGGGPELDLLYEMPMAQHAALEPVNATAHVANGICRLWAPVQMATLAKQEIAKALDFPEDNVVVHTTLLGGSFGRKLERDYAVEAARIAALAGVPVQLLLTREDDMAEGGVRPPSVHRLRFWQGHDGRPCLRHDYATPSVNLQQDPDQLRHKGYDWTSALGAVDIPYNFAALQVYQRDLDLAAVRLNWWRGTHHNNHAFASECALDEYALLHGLDPVDLRLSLLAENFQAETFPGDLSLIEVDRLKALLLRLKQVVADRGPLPPGHAIGIACHVYSDASTLVAHAVEVSLAAGRVDIHKIWVLVDCGVAVAPGSVRAQAEGSVVFGLTSAFWGETTVEAGRIVERNFDSYRLMRHDEVTETEVIILSSAECPGGMGEPPLPSVTPALLNAIARAGGPRIRRLPIGNQLEEI